jgi:hypothetical protein
MVGYKEALNLLGLKVITATSRYATATNKGTLAVTPVVGNSRAAINPPLTIAKLTTTS